MNALVKVAWPRVHTACPGVLTLLPHLTLQATGHALLCGKVLTHSASATACQAASPTGARVRREDFARAAALFMPVGGTGAGPSTGAGGGGDDGGGDDMFAESDDEAAGAAPPAGAAAPAAGAAGADTSTPAAASQERAAAAVDATGTGAAREAAMDGAAAVPPPRASQNGGDAAEVAGTAPSGQSDVSEAKKSGGGGGAAAAARAPAPAVAYAGTAVDEDTYAEWPVKELRRFLTERGRDTAGIVDKAELVAEARPRCSSSHMLMRSAHAHVGWAAG